MTGLPLAFAAPAVLAALVLVPAILLLLRVTPPPPRRLPLPTLPLVRDLVPERRRPARTPWWLLLLRGLAAAALILAMAGPVWNPLPAAPGAGPLLVLLDDGPAAAPDWAARAERAADLAGAAGAAGRLVALRTVSEAPSPVAPGPAGDALARLRALTPVPHLPDRGAALPPIQAWLAAEPAAEVAWISDGALPSRGEAAATDPLGPALAALAPGRLTVHAGASRLVALAGPRNLPEALVVRALRADEGAGPAGVLRALDRAGRLLGEAPFAFAPGAVEAEARLALPLELRNEAARLEVAGQRSAGAVSLLDAGSQRRRVGLVSGESADLAGPLVSPAYYVARALAPFADVREAPRGAPDPVGRLIEDGATAIVLVDSGNLAGPSLERLRRFVEEGGALVRFASRRADAAADDLLPVRLRRGGRVLGGALSWGSPQRLAPFPEEGPLAGLAVPGDVTVSQQVLAEPDAGLAARTWAALEDGTPLVTGERRGRGAVALFHVTADPSWSSLPLSGAFVEALRRLVALGGGEAAEEGEEAPPGAAAAERPGDLLAPYRALDGFGTLGAPPGTARPAPRRSREPADAARPPGLYGPPESPVAVNALAADARLAPLPAPPGVPRRDLTGGGALDLRPALLAGALAIFLVEALATLALAGGLARLVPRRAAAALALGLALSALAGGAPGPARAQAPAPPVPAPPAPAVPGPAAPARDPLAFRADDVEAALATRLAYVVTGDAAVDETSRQGLAGLTRALANRTALEPGEPIGVDPARDELVFYPLLYWPVVAGRPAAPEAATRRLDAYMRNGGTVVFDTRDALTARPGGPPTPEARALRALLATLEVPALEPVPRDHVVNRAFYILDGFPGRFAGGQTWIEALPPAEEGAPPRPARSGDRVSPIVMTGNDLAAAWAVDREGRPRFPVVGGGERQREMSLRSGVNLVIYALTGNYKADQVHVPALLERLGQ